MDLKDHLVQTPLLWAGTHTTRNPVLNVLFKQAFAHRQGWDPTASLTHKTDVQQMDFEIK